MEFSGENLSIDLRRTPTQHNLPQARISALDKVPQLHFNGETCALTHYMVEMGQNAKNFAEIRNALDSGVPGVWIHANWRYDQEGNPDFSRIDTLCECILARHPQANIMITLMLEWVNNNGMAPFAAKHPETLAKQADGRTGIRNYSERPEESPSFASREWLAEGDRVLAALATHLDSRPYGSRVTGILPCAGITWEWMYWGCQREGEWVDYSEPFRQAFADFALARHGSLEAINRAWSKSFPTLDAITIPSPEERRQALAGDLRIPALDSYQTDFCDCMAKVTAEAICHFCHTVKQATGGRTLAGAYYGYVNVLTNGRWAQHSGHWGVAQVLHSKDVDIIMSPTKYGDRGPGQAGGFMPPHSSVRLNGKACVAESDIRTLHAGNNSVGICRTLRESRAVLEREVGALLATGGSMRYYDFSLGWVFGDARLARVAARLNAVEKLLTAANPTLRVPQDSLAVINCDNAASATTLQSEINAAFVTYQYPQLPRTGLSFDSYILADLEIIPLAHRAWWFLNPVRLTPRQVDYIRQNLLKNGKTVIFGYGAGVIGETGLDLRAMETLTGMSFQMDTAKMPRQGILTPAGQAIFGQEAPTRFSVNVPSVSPVFYPVDGGVTLATLRTGQPVLAMSSQNGCRVIFHSLPALPAEWVRAIGIQAGLNCYNPNAGDITWAGGDCFTIHTASGGVRTLQPGNRYHEARELLSGQEFPVKDGCFRFEFPAMSTGVFLCQ